MDLPLIKEIVFIDPPTKFTLLYKNPKFDKSGKRIMGQVFYLTNNLFYSDRTSYHITSKIIYETKEYLYPYLKSLPELEKIAIEFEYHSLKHIDLDNKFGFFLKLILDILKTPTEKQVALSVKRKKPIITTNTIQDDNTKCIAKMSAEFILGEHKMVIRIFGKVKDEQKTLDLFFK